MIRRDFYARRGAFSNLPGGHLYSLYFTSHGQGVDSRHGCIRRNAVISHAIHIESSHISCERLTERKLTGKKVATGTVARNSDIVRDHRTSVWMSSIVFSVHLAEADATIEGKVLTSFSGLSFSVDLVRTQYRRFDLQGTCVPIAKLIANGKCRVIRNRM